MLQRVQNFFSPKQPEAFPEVDARLKLAQDTKDVRERVSLFCQAALMLPSHQSKRAFNIWQYSAWNHAFCSQFGEMNAKDRLEAVCEVIKTRFQLPTKMPNVYDELEVYNSLEFHRDLEVAVSCHEQQIEEARRQYKSDPFFSSIYLGWALRFIDIADLCYQYIDHMREAKRVDPTIDRINQYRLNNYDNVLIDARMILEKAKRFAAKEPKAQEKCNAFLKIATRLSTRHTSSYCIRLLIDVIHEGISERLIAELTDEQRVHMQIAFLKLYPRSYDAKISGKSGNEDSPLTRPLLQAQYFISLAQDEIQRRHTILREFYNNQERYAIREMMMMGRIDIEQCEQERLSKVRCPICIDNFLPSDRDVRILPCCRQYIHLHCTEPMGRTFTCPLCRRPRVSVCKTS